MLSKKEYKNGQRVFEINGKLLTYFYANGTKKSEGNIVDEQMEGEWLFYRETGQLWQIGHFLRGQKEGNWKRWSREDILEYDEEFALGKMLKK